MRREHAEYKSLPNFSKDEIADQLVFQIRRRCKNRVKPQILRIIGLPACGKTVLAQTVVAKLSDHKISSVTYEDTTEILFSREKRSLEHLSGIDYNIYNYSDMRNNLQSLLDGHSVVVGNYSHEKGSPIKNEVKLESKDVIILDGYGWQNGIFRHLLEKENTVTVSLLPLDTRAWRDYSVFRDSTKRNYSENDADKRFAGLKKTFLSNANDIPILEVDNYFVVCKVDNRRKHDDQYLYTPGPKNSWPHIDLELERMNNIFLAYQFSDDELVEGLRKNKGVKSRIANI